MYRALRAMVFCSYECARSAWHYIQTTGVKAEPATKQPGAEEMNMQLLHNASAMHKLRASVLLSIGILICCPKSASLLASASVTYIQGSYSTPQTPQTSVSVTYTGAQAYGDLNVVVVGWNDSTATVAKVSDTAGNVYTLAVGPTIVSGVASQSIFYAANIVAAAAGANRVTVTFSVAAVSADIRILEYSGAATLNPVDVVSASTGNSTVTSSGSATTANANDLIVGANLVLGTTTGPGNGFTQRLLTAPDGDIVEDQIVTAAGSYSATAPQNPSNAWIMQMVAFKAAGGGGSTSPCDLNADGAINVLDVQLATDMDLGTVPCSGPSGICNAMFVQGTLNAALGQPCTMTVVSVSPPAINFGNVTVGNKGTQTSTLAVSGTGSTTISQISVTPSAFTIAGPALPLTLATGQNAIFNVVFTPTSTGTTSGNIAIVSSALISPVNQTVSGNGVNGTHSVTLTWNASSSQNVAGYNVYRIASSSPSAPNPPYSKLNTSLISGLTYSDSSVLAGTSYYYYATAVDASNNESSPSNTAQAVVPSP